MEKVNLPEGQSGDWKIEIFEVSEQEAQFDNIRNLINARSRYMSPGRYTRLTYCGRVIMSDTHDEMYDHQFFVHRAKGNILINGLGIGMVLKNVLLKPEVDLVIVNELSEDVIKLVASHYQDPRLTINHTDAFTWKPKNGLKFDNIWHDIWISRCTDNLEDMKKLCRRYGKWKTPNGYQGCWSREQLEYYKRKERRRW